MDRNLTLHLRSFSLLLRGRQRTITLTVSDMVVRVELANVAMTHTNESQVVEQHSNKCCIQGGLRSTVSTSPSGRVCAVCVWVDRQARKGPATCGQSAQSNMAKRQSVPPPHTNMATMAKVEDAHAANLLTVFNQQSQPIHVWLPALWPAYGRKTFQKDDFRQQKVVMTMERLGQFQTKTSLLFSLFDYNKFPVTLCQGSKIDRSIAWIWSGFRSGEEDVFKKQDGNGSNKPCTLLTTYASRGWETCFAGTLARQRGSCLSVAKSGFWSAEICRSRRGRPIDVTLDW